MLETFFIVLVVLCVYYFGADNFSKPKCGDVVPNLPFVPEILHDCLSFIGLIKTVVFDIYFNKKI